MPGPSERPLRKVTLNLFARDVESLIARYGHGWTEQVRLIVEKNCAEHRAIRETLTEIFDNG